MAGARLTISRMVIAANELPRLAAAQLRLALTDSPVVLLHGPRQCGKSTLAQMHGRQQGYTYRTLDDAVTLLAAQSDPVGFVADLRGRVVVDEVQRMPGLFTAIKAAVDRDRTPGRILLTGSANVLLLPEMADSLAGRMAVVRLHPFAQCEILATASDFVDQLFSGHFRQAKAGRLGPELADRIAAGGFPPALARATPARRAAWHRDYVETLVQRDVRDFARIASLHALPKLLAAAAVHSARLLNVSELAAPFSLSRPTIADYMGLLERIFLVEMLQPWHNNALSRLVKTPKLHLTDSGVACTLLGHDPVSLYADKHTLGRLTETFVVQELRRHASGRDEAIGFFHYRDRDGIEVDLVLERGRQVAGVEIKAGATLGEADFRGLRQLQQTTAEAFAGGVVLYDGEHVARFGERLWAVPISELWQSGA